MIVQAVIEMPKGTKYKFEMDKDTGLFVIDRVIHPPVPTNYGFIPNTLCEDGDALDIFVFTDTALPQGHMVNVEIMGGFKCTDNGESDDKLFGIVRGDNSGIAHELIKWYLSKYKPGFIVESRMNQEEAIGVYKKARDLCRSH